eukprot:comp4955_c0_seq1/m.3940 comp4955_c0_seq1/g.3940  ORF comp4955_c0_seq1/g.3940 comp4955_c0_seq1/m.3940 type:complete len:102 (+) comp4955_c0_seq1:11-316(+)
MNLLGFFVLVCFSVPVLGSCSDDEPGCSVSPSAAPSSKPLSDLSREELAQAVAELQRELNARRVADERRVKEHNPAMQIIIYVILVAYPLVWYLLWKYKYI